MKRILTILFLSCFCWGLSAQSIADLEKSYAKEKDMGKKAELAVNLAQKYHEKRNDDKSKLYSKRAYEHAGSISSSTQKNRVRAEAKYYEGKSHGGIYFGSKGFDFRGKRTGPDFNNAKNALNASVSLAKSAGYNQLELYALWNLAQLHSKTYGSYKVRGSSLKSAYEAYVQRSQELKNLTKPQTSTIVINGDGGGSSTPSSGGGASKKELEEIKRQNKNLKDQLEATEDENKKLKDKLNISSEAFEKAKEKEQQFEEMVVKNTELSDMLDENQGKLLRVQSKNKKQKDQIFYIQTENERLAQEQELAEEVNSRFRLGVILGGIIAALVLAFLYFGYAAQKRARKQMSQKNEEIKKEQERSEELLLNILPVHIADELKNQGAAKAKRHDNVTVLFSDFKNFTLVSETLSPEDLVKELDYCFKGFDFIISQYPTIEKIKTIGDAYMAVSGLYGDNYKAAEEMSRAALDMQEFLEDYRLDRQAKGMPYFEARIGVHSGPVVAGVVGNKKFAYDVWGDTVNVASRMESNGEVGKVNISADTFDQVRYKFVCSSRGRIQVKNKGLVEMYFLDKEYV